MGYGELSSLNKETFNVQANLTVNWGIDSLTVIEQQVTPKSSHWIANRTSKKLTENTYGLENEEHACNLDKGSSYFPSGSSQLST